MDDDAEFKRQRDALRSRIDELSEKLRRLDEILEAAAALTHGHGDAGRGADSYDSVAWSSLPRQHNRAPVPSAAVSDDDGPEYPISQWEVEHHYYLYNDADGDHHHDVLTAGEATPARFSDGGFGGIPASAAAIAALKKQRYDGSSSGAHNMCTICMRHYKKGRRLCVVPCAFKHRFHRKCIRRWLSRSHLCPLCRHALPTEDDQQGVVAQATAVNVS